ncbi:MAG TPA: NAD(P)H-dependent oxidoreductase [Labilithrix sp.]|nr:NAD(P)H-dependent oxidoreductase [Labilithrix sp.]
MRVLTIYANPNPKSFCHAVLERFTKGLADAGHTSEVVDLYAIDFDPVLRTRDAPSWMDPDLPQEILDRWNLEHEMLAGAGGPLRRFLVKRWIGNKDTRGIIRALRKERIPKDVLEQQAKVARAEALVFIAPVWFVGFPAILKGWIERVFTLGFAFDLSADGWRGDLAGRRPLLKHDKALIINTTLFDEAAYGTGIGDAMKRLVDEFALTYPGIKHVDHVYFHAVYGADDATRRSYLERAYRLGLDFGVATATADAAQPARAAGAAHAAEHGA